MKFTLLIISLFSAITLTAQSDFDLTQKRFNESVYNPAATGNSFTTGVFLHGRIQWAGLDGAPTNQAISFDTYIEQINSAIGVSFLGDQIGYMDSYSAKISYAYYVPLTRHSTISFGLSAGIANKTRVLNPNFAGDPTDPLVSSANRSNTLPDFDFGVEYKGPVKIGVSLRHLGQKNMASKNAIGTQSINIWSYASSRFNLSNNTSIEPMVAHTYRNGISRFEGSALLYFLKSDSKIKYNDKMWIGASYSSNQTVSALLGMHITRKIRLGYSFDYGMGDLSGITKSGTHEIFLSWQFNKIFYKDAPCPAYKGYKKRKRR